MPDSIDTLIDYVLRATLLSNDIYGDETVDASYPPVGFERDPAETVDRQVEYLRFFLAHSAEMAATLEILEDEASRDLFRALLLFRILGYRRVKLPVNGAAIEDARARSLEPAETPSRLDYPGDALLHHYDWENASKPRKLDCWRANLFFTFFLKQYYFLRDGVYIGPAPGDVVVDGGGCFGDTSIGFADAVESSGAVHSFEVVSSHLDIMRYNLAQNPDLENITIHACALGETDRPGGIAEGLPNPGYCVQQATSILTRTLDSMVESGEMPRVDFLKMDMEGSELAALRGAANTIRTFRPKIAVALYHKWEDYFTIPQFLRSLNAGYRLYLANYTHVDGETVLYAISDRAVAPIETGMAAAPPLDDAPESLA